MACISSTRFQVYNCSSETVSKYLQELKAIEEEYSSCFTGRNNSYVDALHSIYLHYKALHLYIPVLVALGKIEVSGGLDNIVKQVKTEIANQQNMALWEEEC